MSLFQSIRKKAVLFFIIFFLSIAGLFFFIKIKSGSTTQTNRRFSVFIIFFDGLRHDYLSDCDKQNLTQSNICQLANEGVIFKKHFSQSRLFSASLVSLLTSAGKNTHGMKRENLQSFNLAEDKILTFNISDTGFKTAVFADWAPIIKKYSQKLGFGHVDAKGDHEKRFRDANRWIIKNNDEYIFALIHCKVLKKIKNFKLNDYPKKILRYYYDEDLTEIDVYLGRLFGLLKALGKWDDSIIIITSARGVGGPLSRSTGLGPGKKFPVHSRHIPLIIKPPKVLNIKSRKIFKKTLLVDIMPTILDMLSLDIPENLEGKSLLDLIAEDGES